MKFIVKIYLSLFCYFAPTLAMAEDKNDDILALDKIVKNIQFSGYFQGQYQYGQKDVYKLSVGADNENYEKKSFNRLGLRRAFISTYYQSGIVSALFTLEARDRSLWFSDAFIQIDDPWKKGLSATIGSFNPMFGYELSVSPSQYELAEGTWFIYNLFPDIYDIGLKFTYQAAKKYGYTSINLGIVGGNGVHQETDSRKDFFACISASTDKEKKIHLKGGFSYYRGFVYQGTENIYTMSGDGFQISKNINNIGEYAKREYFDLNAQVILNSAIGRSELRSEVIWGTQPGGKFSNDSPNSNERPIIDTYIRNFQGGYLYYLQQIGSKLPLTLFTGYNWYNPNRKVSSNKIGLNNTTYADTKNQIAVLGLIWFPYPPVRIQMFYEIPFNEKSENLTDFGYDRHRKSNVFTLRLQYKF